LYIQPFSHIFPATLVKSALFPLTIRPTQQPLKEAKPNEDPDGLCTSDKVLLTDDQLDSVAGGVALKTQHVEQKVIK
jgi:hypothetical protein